MSHPGIGRWRRLRAYVLRALRHMMALRIHHLPWQIMTSRPQTKISRARLGSPIGEKKTRNLTAQAIDARHGELVLARPAHPVLEVKPFTKAQRRKAAAIIQATRKSWQTSESRRSEIDARQQRQLRRDARSAMLTELNRALPQLDRVAAPKLKLRRERQKIRRLHLQQLMTAQAKSEIPPANALPARHFSAPFANGNVFSKPDSDVRIDDRSIVHPEIGHLINNFNFDYTYDSGIGMQSVFGLAPKTTSSSLVTCGITYRMPRAGRLLIRGEMKNFYSKVFVSLQDNFGLSDGQIDVALNLVITVTRLQEAVQFRKTLLSDSLSSDGDDATELLPNVDEESIHVMSRTTAAPLYENESVNISIGSEVEITAQVDDMDAHVNALLWWQLERLSLSIV